MYKVELEDKDYLSKDKYIDLSGDNTLYIPLVINFKTDVVPLGKKGSRVKKNQPIATSESIDFSLLSLVSLKRFKKEHI